MSRSGYDDDYGCDDPLASGRYRGAVASAIRGKNGQAFLKELLAAFDKIEPKRLVSWELEKDGEICALGAVGRERGIDMSGMDPEDIENVALTFGINEKLAREIVYMNDECGPHKETPEARYERMRHWITSQIHEVAP